ncbi:MAG: preprotein translocase subunit SecG [Synergistales bacterium]|nr:preprotein translocase subunit SecG [Synergistales bacterium]
MRIALYIIHVLLGLTLIGVVLLQQRKQGGFTGVFGGGTQADASGGQWQRFTALSKISVILIALFMLSSVVIVFLFR